MNTLAKHSLVTLCATAVIAVPLAFGGKPAPPPGSIQATDLIYDQDTSVPPNQYLFRSDLFGGLNTTTYTATGGVTTGINLGSPYGWSLELYTQSLRRVWISLTPVNGATPPAPNGLYAEKVQIYSWCFDSAGNQTSYLSIPAGTSNNRCIFSFDFLYGKTTYKLALGQFSGQYSSPASGSATVTCHASSSPSGTPCTSWTIAPNMIDANATIANLYIIGGHNGPQFIGQYYNTFRIDVTTP